MTFLRSPQRQAVYQSLAGLDKAAHGVGFFLPQAFQLDDDAPRVVAQPSHVVELRLLADRDKAAVTREQRQIGPE
jgi:hypothetical protein